MGDIADSGEVYIVDCDVDAIATDPREAGGGSSPKRPCTRGKSKRWNQRKSQGEQQKEVNKRLKPIRFSRANIPKVTGSHNYKQNK